MVGQDLGHYAILDKLGAGGLGEVYLAEDEKLKRKVALKVLPSDIASSPERLRRFQREAQSLAALNHPNIVHVYSVEEEQGLHFLTMELVDGMHLGDLLPAEGLPLDKIFDLAIPLADALSEAHERGIVHRDLKPANVMVDTKGRPKILDFGLAEHRQIGAPDDFTELPTEVLTEDGRVLGTYPYMSPEQVQGKPVDERSDLFSFGIILYEMATGHRPFQGESVASLMSAILRDTPPGVDEIRAELPHDLSRIIRCCLEKDPESRYQTAKDVCNELAGLRTEIDSRVETRASDAPTGLPTDEAELHLAHVLFCDIVGYSLLPIDQQTQMMRTLQEIVSKNEECRRADARHQLVRLPAGDGMALAFLQDPSAPIRCAFDIVRALQGHSEIKLRIGVHSGPVFRSADINANLNVVGSGINIAQRVMDCGDAGHILVSRNVAEVLNEVSQWRGYLHDLGEVEVKHGMKMHLFNLYGEGLGNAELPSRLRGKSESIAQKAPRAGLLPSEIKRHGRSALIILAVLVAAAAGFYFANSRYFSGSEDAGSGAPAGASRSSPPGDSVQQSAMPSGDSRPSIAVLPFADLSPGKDQEYLSDGIAEELLNMLATVGQLRVISRSSAFSFKGRNIQAPEIAMRLNVEHILEGSVRLSGDNVRVSARLIDARSDAQLWSQTWDRHLDYVFAVQDEIATAVVKQLKIDLLGETSTPKAENAEAYVLFLQAREVARRGTAEGWEESNALYEQALALDQGYAPAWGGLADNYMNQVGNGLRPKAEGVPLAREAVRNALALDPGFALGFGSLGWFTMSFDGDLLAAARHFEHALELAPANTDLLRNAATLAQHLGRLDTAMVLGKYVVAQDPVAPNGYHNLGTAQYYAGQLDESIESMRTALRLAPGHFSAEATIGGALLAKGEPEAALAAIEKESHDVWRLIGLPMAYHDLERNVESDAAVVELIEKYEQDAPYNIAYVFAYLGKANLAFAWLDKAVMNGDPGLLDIAVQPEFANIRSDPRWLPFLRKLGRAPEQLAAIPFKVDLPR